MRLERLSDQPRPAVHRAETATLYAARVTAVAADGGCRLADGRAVPRAAGCLLAPAAGDHVLCIASAAGDYVVQVLGRAPGGAAELSVAGADALRLRQTEVELLAERSLCLTSLGGIDVVAAGGGLAMQARDVFLTATESLIETARERLAEAENYALQVKSLLRLHGRDALLTAERDVKVDAERISMG